MVKDTILYDRLNIKSNSNNNEIKKGYRKMSIKWHPDKNPDNNEEATTKFQEISEAYTILIDEKKRQLYDKIGIDILNNDQEGFDPSSIFEQFFGEMNNMGGFPFGFNNPNESNLEDCYAKTKVTLDQIYNEEKIKILYEQKNFCKDCDGTGSSNKIKPTCQNCDGKGQTVQVIRMGPMIQQAIVPCNNCNGTGKKLEQINLCKNCNGQSFKIRNKSISLPLKSGLKTGNKIKMEKKGHQFKEGRTDLIIEIFLEEHSIFKRHGNNLIYTMELKLYQSLIGFNKKIDHLDRRELHVSYNKQIKEGDIKIIENEGLYDLSTNEKGDLHIIFTVKYPDLEKLSKKESDLLKVLLAKTEKDELENESIIYKRKKNLVNTKLIDPQNYNNYNEENSQNHNNPGCVQQ